MDNKLWLVVNIGCIECGVSSNIVGLFDNQERADAIAETLDEKMSWREGGQNSFEVFALPALNEIGEEYREALAPPPPPSASPQEGE